MLGPAIEENNAGEIVQALMAGYPVDEPINAEGTTLLMKAIKEKNTDMISRIMKYHPDVNKQDAQGMSALDYANQANLSDLL